MIQLLSDASTFRFSESMGSNRISQSIKLLANEKEGAIFVNEEQLEDVLYKIRHKSFNFTAKFAALELYRKGIIRLVYNPNVKVTVAVPYFKMRLPDGNIGVVVNITNYARMKSDGTITIDPLTLYVLMLTGAFSINYERNIGLVINNALPELYGAMSASVFSRIVIMDQAKKEKIKYIMTKFLYIAGGSNEVSASTSAAKECRNIDKYVIEQLDLALPIQAYENLETLIKGINTAFPEFTGLSLGVYFDRWMRAYGEPTAFACEYIPFFITVFCALVANCNNIVNVKAIEKDANRHGSRLVTLFSRIENAVIGMVR